MKRSRSVHAAIAAIVISTIGVGLPITPALSAPMTYTAPSSPNGPDPYYPTQGNGGYDVQRYSLTVKTDPRVGSLEGRALITARTIGSLQTWYLDLRGLDVTSVLVSGQPASWQRMGDELQISVPRQIFSGVTFTMDVRYTGTPVSVAQPFNTRYPGWHRTMDGVAVVSEPNGASTWFPNNNHPTDKALYDITVIVPRGMAGVANGLPDPTVTDGDWESTTWRVNQPMATYNATVIAGTFTVHRSTLGRSLPVIDVVSSWRPEALTDLAQIRTVLPWLKSRLGAYPFDVVGSTVLADNFGGAMEHQTRPTYSGGYFVTPGSPMITRLMVHELAHQWLGDNITPARWQDIWLNEGFATYMEWLWYEEHGGPTAEDTFTELACSSDAIWSPAPGVPDPTNLFTRSVYDRGAMTLQALRREVGRATFLRILKTWATPTDGSARRTADFVSLAEQISGRDLDPLFNRWLYPTTRPEDAQCLTGAAAQTDGSRAAA